jgi:eukaryotic-like serine/threonine-protein kinase
MKAFVVVLIAFGTSLLTSVSTLYVMERVQPFVRSETAQREVPNLLGLSEADARTNVEASELRLMVAGREPSPDVDEGVVLRQEPTAGARLDAGAVVRVTFAAALPLVPEVRGRSIDEATSRLEEAGFSVRVVEAAPSDEHAAGLVALQTPAAGERLQPKGRVVLTPSSGSGVLEVPKFVGMNLASAKAAAEELGLELGVQWISVGETATHVVLRQTPAPGTETEPKAKVTVVINR